MPTVSTVPTESPKPCSGSVMTVIPVYNGEPYLEDTLRSLATQTHPPERLIIIDDGSTDKTEELVKSFQDLPCEWHPNANNLGLFPNLNQALTWASKTDYFHLMLADDRVEPDFLESSLATLIDEPVHSFSWCDTQWIDASGKQLPPLQPDHPVAGRLFDKRQFMKRECELQTISVGSVLIKTQQKPLACRFRTDMPQVADCVFFGELASVAPRIKHIPRPLCQIRTHAFNMTHRNIRNLDAWVRDEWRAMNLIASLMDESPWKRWVRRQKLKSLFAARCRVKEQWMSQEDPSYAQAIYQASLEAAGRCHHILGRAAVQIRDCLKGPRLRQS